MLQTRVSAGGVTPRQRRLQLHGQWPLPLDMPAPPVSGAEGPGGFGARSGYFGPSMVRRDGVIVDLLELLKDPDLDPGTLGPGVEQSGQLSGYPSPERYLAAAPLSRGASGAFSATSPPRRPPHQAPPGSRCVSGQDLKIGLDFSTSPSSAPLLRHSS